VALMCAEEDPERCHRWLLVGRTLVARGMTVVDIGGDGAASAAADSGQLTLFDRG